MRSRIKNFNIMGARRGGGGVTENPIFRKGMRGVSKIYLSKKGRGLGGSDSFKI